MNMTRRSQNTCCFLDDLPIAKIIKVPLFYSSDFVTDIDNAIMAVSVFYCEAVNPADKIKAQETLSKRLLKTTG